MVQIAFATFAFILHSSKYLFLPSKPQPRPYVPSFPGDDSVAARPRCRLLTPPQLSQYSIGVRQHCPRCDVAVAQSAGAHLRPSRSPWLRLFVWSMAFQRGFHFLRRAFVEVGHLDEYSETVDTLAIWRVSAPLPYVISHRKCDQPAGLHHPQGGQTQHVSQPTSICSQHHLPVRCVAPFDFSCCRGRS
ncbi:hypothetical protein BD310DRAFT_178906 [Dichomitus squalens]|uniref:Uncharacterized protein n=1 Tax=Dichomitus squalens TaxID=114155 RepID=A0A4Q9PHM2_9APHY|nr:hypothetical protein BD310DRAFT_178906 [Dichomitus squalens]